MKISIKSLIRKEIKNLVDDPFQALHLRLLLSYLGVMSTVLGAMLLFVYQHFASNLYSKFDRQLATLADAASHSLPKLSNINLAQDPIQRDRVFDNDGDLDIPWQDLRGNQQMIEWFDITGKLLTRSGNQKIPTLTFNPDDHNLVNAKVQQLEENDDLRSLVIPIYLEGFISNTVFFKSPEKYEYDDDELNKDDHKNNRKKNKNYQDKDVYRNKLNSDFDESQRVLQSSFLLNLFINNGNDFRRQSINPKRVLIGYVRVSEPSEEIEEELEGLISGLIWGGLLAITLSAVGGWWLAWQALQPIERNYKQMRQFTADASHELRSPLTAIKTSIEVIQSHPERIHGADVKKVTAIAKATEQMANLVEDLLFLARVDNANLEPAASPNLLSIPLDELIEDLLDSLEPQILAKALDLEISLAPAITIRGEANQLRRLFINLLENAIAYSSTGGKIGVQLEQISLQTIQVAVTDTGLGIEAEDLPHIFERFWRADRARTWRSGGSGLGLAIAQAIANSHGGSITVSSQIGVGSCFIVNFAIS
ncbi:MAG: hypothetical protein AUK48_06685 [Oscillatoriales cyanobacterium CG2_30_44_21]|nr:MAG: hypothetical protein AUK48_06685 [Oscillatoriales cyanobacterium CG2_30_44_21]